MGKFEVKIDSIEREEGCEGSVTVMFSMLTVEHKKMLEGYIRGAISQVRNSEKGIPKYTPGNLTGNRPQDRAQKKEEVKKELPPKKEIKKNILRGYLTVFIRGLTCKREDVVKLFRERYPDRTDSEESVLRVWDAHHPYTPNNESHPDKIPTDTLRPVQGDKVRYRHSAIAPVGTVEDVDRNGLKMRIRFGINDVKSAFCADYIVISKGGPAAR
jgi:hypothetical protein